MGSEDGREMDVEDFLTIMGVIYASDFGESSRNLKIGKGMWQIMIKWIMALDVHGEMVEKNDLSPEKYRQALETLPTGFVSTPRERFVAGMTYYRGEDRRRKEEVLRAIDLVSRS
jgi:hypothetical protein